MAAQEPDNAAPVRAGRLPALDPHYRFLAMTPPAAGGWMRRNAVRLASAVALHLVMLFTIKAVVERAPAPSPGPVAPKASIPLVWRPSPGGGSPKGSGGQEAPTPAQRAQLVGRDAITVPAATPPRLDPATIVEPPPQRLEMPVVPVASGVQELVGTIAEVSRVDLSTRGPGSGPGAGDRRGTGSGGRDGDRVGNGDRGPGDGDEFMPGNGVSWPRLVQEVKPNYTADAMRAQVRGVVELEILVLPDGSVGRVHIVRSLDSRFGLDEEAIRAVRRWRFDPGRRLGKAVATRVGVEMAFSLR
jgi:protein TonB